MCVRLCYTNRMSKGKHSLLRIYAFSTTVSILLIILAGWKAGITGLFLVLVLAALEVSLSFDNAVVNARILRRMSDAWQKAFLTVGILIAVFGVRIVLPILLVAIAVGSSFGEVVHLAINDPTEYGHKLESAHYLIASFGGTFLMMIFLDFFFEKRKTLWLPWIERRMQSIGTLKNISPMIAVGAVLGASQIVDSAHQETVLVSGLIGLLVYLVIHSIDNLLQKSGIDKNIGKTGVNNTFKAGLIGFIYLEVIDASFSLDGVIGAFAITNQILLIAIGLCIGALYVRTITVHMLKRGVLDSYRFIEHGAHYAIGVLAAIMLISLKFEVPEVITGLTGLTIIITSIICSNIAKKRDEAIKA